MIGTIILIVVWACATFYAMWREHSSDDTTPYDTIECDHEGGV